MDTLHLAPDPPFRIIVILPLAMWQMISFPIIRSNEISHRASELYIPDRCMDSNGLIHTMQPLTMHGRDAH